jgi:hypothetical protein
MAKINITCVTDDFIRSLFCIFLLPVREFHPLINANPSKTIFEGNPHILHLTSKSSSLRSPMRVQNPL